MVFSNPPFMADAANLEHSHHPHFLVVAYGIQSHINSAQRLAHRLARIDTSVMSTLSVHVAAHTHMFPSLASPDEETSDGVISYAPFSDGFDDTTKLIKLTDEERARSRRASFESLSAVVSRFAARGRPVTCIVCTMAMPPVLNVAREHGIPLAVFWNQPATVLAVYYHYYHGYKEVFTSHASDPSYQVMLPGMQPLNIDSLPSFLVDMTGSRLSNMVIQEFQELFEFMDREKPKVLVNTFNAIEAATLTAMQPYLPEMFAVGHLPGPAKARINMFQQDEKSYIDWLGTHSERSVVYISFGSILTYSMKQVEAILHGMRECGRPYLWVVRKDDEHEKEVSNLVENIDDHHKGMVVKWCDQIDVLSHPSVGCFITHGGWNSTLEALTLGVPMVVVPNWSDQPTNAYLVDKEWKVGTRAKHNSEGVLVATELARCVELVMGDSEIAVDIKETSNAFRRRINEEVTAVGSSERSLQSFAKTMIAPRKGF